MKKTDQEFKWYFKVIPYIPVLGAILVILFGKKYKYGQMDNNTHLNLVTAIIQGISVSVTIIYLFEKYVS